MKKDQERQRNKSSEGEFIFELLHEYELSPRESQSILETAKNCLIRDNVLKEGQIEVSVIAITERSGRMIETMKKTRVRLMIDKGIDDIEVLRSWGRIALRGVRIQRITEEAIEQEGILSQEDIGKYLSCSIRTVKRDIRKLKETGIDVLTRGVLHNIGRCQTHKVKIIGLYLEGKSFSEIGHQTHHSVGSIKRYLQDFQKVLMSLHHGIKDLLSLSSVTGLSKTLLNQYIELIRLSRRDKFRKLRMEDMIKQWKRAGTRIKKKEVTGKDYMQSLAPMIGGMK